MQKKEIVLTLELLVRMDASEKLLEFFKERYPNSSATLSEVLSDLQELANTDTEYPDYEKYVDHAIWLILYSPPTQEPLVLNELTEKVIIHNGDVTINCDIDGDYVIIGNGKLNIKGDANVTGYAYIWAKENIDAKNIKADGHARIWVGKTIKAINIKADGHARIWVAESVNPVNIKAYGKAEISAESVNPVNIWAKGYAKIIAITMDAINIGANKYAKIWVDETIKAINIKAYGKAEIWAESVDVKDITADGDVRIDAKENIDAKNIKADGHARIWANEIIKAINIAAYGYAGILADKTIDAKNIKADGDAKISALEINTQNINDDGTGIYGDINLIQPSSNPENTNTAS